MTNLSSSVGVNGTNRRSDNAKVQALLARANHLKLARTQGPTGYGLFTLDNAINSFQRDHGLKIDGRIDPGGPTIQKLAGITKTAKTINPPAEPIGVAHHRSDVAASVSQLLSVPAEQRSSRDGFTGHVAPAQIQATRSTLQTSIQTMPIPTYREQVFLPRQKEWMDWQRSVAGLAGVTPNEFRSYAEIFAAEGGRKVNSNSGAIAGILPETLADLRARGKLPTIQQGTFMSPLRESEIASVYRAYFDDALRTIGGHMALAGLPDSETAAAFADAMFRHGRRNGARVVQRAINNVAQGTVTEDGRMGPQTFNAYRALTANPATRQRLLDSLANERIRISQNSPNLVGETARFNHFRFQNSPGKSSP